MEDLKDHYERLAEEQERYTEDPTDDELLGFELGEDENLEGLEKAGPYKYKSRKKVGDRWVYDYGEKKPTESKRTAVYAALPGKKITGKLPPGKSAVEHIAMAKEFLGRHEQVLPQSISALKGLAGPKASVKGRVKTPHSALNKMAKKPKYKTADMLQDGSGLRVIHQSVAEVKDTVAKIKAKYKTLDEDDYISKPQGDYRSHHLIIEGPEGLAMEVQVRTENQNTFADWCHDVYKPMNPTQQEYADHPDVTQYAKGISDYFWDLDTGKDPPPTKPPCTQSVSRAFGCL